MALTKRQLQNIYKDEEAKKEKEEKLQKLREGYMKDPSLAVPEKQTPAGKTAGVNVPSGMNLSADQKSGQAVLGAMQGIGMYSKELPV